MADLVCCAWIPSAFTFSYLGRCCSLWLLEVLKEPVGTSASGSTGLAVPLGWFALKEQQIPCWYAEQASSCKSVGAGGSILFMVRALDFHPFISPCSQTFMFTAECLVLHWPNHLRTSWDNISCRKLLGGQRTAGSLGSTQKVDLIALQQIFFSW